MSMFRLLLVVLCMEQMGVGEEAGSKAGPVAGERWCWLCSHSGRRDGEEQLQVRQALWIILRDQVSRWVSDDEDA